MALNPITQTGHGVNAALYGIPVRKPVMDGDALREAIRVQARTWVTRTWGAPVPENPEMTNGPHSLARMVARITRHAEDFEGRHDDESGWGMAHLIHADSDAVRAAQGHSNATGFLLGCLYSLIVASAYLDGDYEGSPVDFTPYPNDMPALDESALCETVRTLVQVYLPAGVAVHVPDRGSWLDAPRLSDLIGEVANAFEERYGDMDDNDSVQAMAHMVNAREHALKAGYNHGPEYVFACLCSLVLVIASADHL